MKVNPYEPPRDSAPPPTPKPPLHISYDNWWLGFMGAWVVFVFLGLPVVQVITKPIKLWAILISIVLIAGSYLSCRGGKRLFSLVLTAILAYLLVLLAKFPETLN